MAAVCKWRSLPLVWTYAYTPMEPIQHLENIDKASNYVVVI